MLKRDEEVEIPGEKEKFDSFGCLLRTVRYSPNNAHAFVNLGLMLGEKGKQIPIKVAGEPKERMFGKKELLAHALGINPDLDGNVWKQLAESMENDNDFVQIRDKKVTKADLMKALK